MDDTTEQQGQNTLTIEALRDDWWHAVYLPLPDVPPMELVDEAHLAVQYCFTHARNRAANPDKSACGAFEPKYSAYAAKGDAMQHTEAALEKLLELERRWPHDLVRLRDGEYIPESVEALHEDLRRYAEEKKARSNETPDDARDSERQEDKDHTSERSDHGQSRPHNEADAELENDHTFDFDFSRGPSDRSR